jgi:hypothetical protein
METKHRQGEWKTSKPYFNYYVTCNGESICQINASDDEEANAKLIAAAPDLLEALIEMNKWVCVNFPEHGMSHEFGSCASFNKMRTAIKKATE